MNRYLNKLFNLEGKVATVIGGGGHLCSEMVRAFAYSGCKVAILDLRLNKAESIENELQKDGFKDLISMKLDV